MKTAETRSSIIRQQIIRFCIGQSIHPAKLNSTSEYARYFGCSLRTIATVFASLVQEGWIVGKRGDGYYTVPYKHLMNINEHGIVGLVMGDSQMLCYDHNQWSLLAQTGIALSARNIFVTMPSFYGRNADAFYKELEIYDLNGLLVVGGSKMWDDALIRYAGKKHPVVTILEKIGDLPMINVDWFRCGQRLGDLVNQYRFDPEAPFVWSHCYDLNNAEIYRGFLDRCKCQNPKILLKSAYDVQEYLEDRLRHGKKTALLFAFSSSVKPFMHLFSKKDLDIFQETLVIGESWIAGNIPNFRGLVFGYPHEEIGRTAAMMFTKQFEGKTVRDISLDLIVKEIK